MSLTKEETMQSQLRQKEKELFSIQKIGQALSNTLKLDDLLNLIMKEITSLMDADRSTLYLVDKQKQEIWSKIALKAEVKEIRQKFGKGISGYVAKTGEKINIKDAYLDSRFDPSTDKRTGYHTRSILCFPVWEPKHLEEKRQIIGVIQVLNKNEGVFTREDEGILEAIASEVAVAISNARLYQQLEKKYREIDLLYEYELLLSSEYDVKNIFRKILSGMVQHLKCKFAGIIFLLNGQNVLLSISKDGTEDSHTFQQKETELYEIFKEKKNYLGSANVEFLGKYISDLEISDIPYIKVLTVGEADAGTKPVALLYQTMENSRDLYNDADLQLLGIVEQKIERALVLQELRETLIKQERLTAVGKMMSTIVHDLRNPINNISGFTQLLLEEDSTSEEKKEYANIIQLEARAITTMTTEILDFAKGKSSILPRKFSVNDVVKRFKPQVEQLFRDTNIDFSFHINSKKLLHIDIEKFLRVLYNIAKNAKEALADRGEFVIKVGEQDNRIIFELRDNGPGIPEDIRDRLFESFVTSGKQSGTGLGLAIVKKIVEEHRGEIKIKSETGKGTSFIIEIPEMKDN